MPNEDLSVPVPDRWGRQAWVDAQTYRREYERSITDPSSFWSEQAATLDWYRVPRQMQNVSFDPQDLRIRWFEDGEINACVNCLDRHLVHAGRTALIWEGDDPSERRKLSYGELHAAVCRLANGLRELGVRKGDRVTIYLPMVPEAAIAMLACARIGAVHSVVFGGFSAESLAGRIRDCGSQVLITADESVRGGRSIPMKASADVAMRECPSIAHCVVLRRTGAKVGWTEGRDCWYHDLVRRQDMHCEPEVMRAEDPLFILYTSGSTGRPKGVVHTTAGYLLSASLTHRYVFDYRHGDVFWCTADIGWVTGHSYVVYGPLANGATTLMFEGVPSHPNYSRYWQIIDRHRVNIFYTSPTAIRTLIRQGDAPLTNSSRQSLRLLGSVGEPINPEAWRWYYEKVGESRCPIVDTWWQTETGAIVISPLPGAMALKPGSATLPFFGVEPVIVDDSGSPLEGECEGKLCLRQVGPGQARDLFNDHDRFIQTYFASFPGLYFTGDGARRDKDGYYWITGRVDDVINVSGHRIGTVEVESSLASHPDVAEAAVVGFPHPVKGQGIFAFVTLRAGVNATELLRAELSQWVRRGIGPIAVPDTIHLANGLPKTRSGKILRRLLRKIAANDIHDLGDTSTLADESVLASLLGERVHYLRPTTLDGLAAERG